jgi:hypothetical protein
MFSWHSALLIKHRDNFTFTFTTFYHFWAQKTDVLVRIACSQIPALIGTDMSKYSPNSAGSCILVAVPVGKICEHTLWNISAVILSVR